jgi:hypothetical protein
MRMDSAVNRLFAKCDFAVSAQNGTGAQARSARRIPSDEIGKRELAKECDRLLRAVEHVRVRRHLLCSQPDNFERETSVRRRWCC